MSMSKGAAPDSFQGKGPQEGQWVFMPKQSPPSNRVQNGYLDKGKGKKGGKDGVKGGDMGKGKAGKAGKEQGSKGSKGSYNKGYGGEKGGAGKAGNGQHPFRHPFDPNRPFQWCGNCYCPEYGQRAWRFLDVKHVPPICYHCNSYFGPIPGTGTVKQMNGNQQQQSYYTMPTTNNNSNSSSKQQQQQQQQQQEKLPLADEVARLLQSRGIAPDCPEVKSILDAAANVIEVKEVSKEPVVHPGMKQFDHKVRVAEQKLAKANKALTALTKVELALVAQKEAQKEVNIAEHAREVHLQAISVLNPSDSEEEQNPTDMAMDAIEASHTQVSGIFESMLEEDQDRLFKRLVRERMAMGKTICKNFKVTQPRVRKGARRLAEEVGSSGMSDEVDDSDYRRKKGRQQEEPGESSGAGEITDATSDSQWPWANTEDEGAVEEEGDGLPSITPEEIAQHAQEVMARAHLVNPTPAPPPAVASGPTSFPFANNEVPVATVPATPVASIPHCG